MSKTYKPTNSNRYLFQKHYRVNNRFSHDYDQLSSLVKWWEYLDVEHYRYRIVMMVLEYDSQHDHQSSNITKFIKSLREKYKVDDVKVPIHSVWKLEHREGDLKGHATGWHYHVVFAINQDIVFDLNYSFMPLVKKCWVYGKVDGIRTHSVPATVELGKRSDGSSYKLPYPIKNTQTEQITGVFHHLSYLTKADQGQSLPENYTGCSFKASQHKKSRLEGHPRIKRHNNKIRLSDGISKVADAVEPIEMVTGNESMGNMSQGDEIANPPATESYVSIDEANGSWLNDYNSYIQTTLTPDMLDGEDVVDCGPSRFVNTVHEAEGNSSGKEEMLF